MPGTPPEWLEDTSIPLAIVEGEKKALALFRLAYHQSGAPRFLPLGIAGVWCWKGTIGQVRDEKGASRKVKGVIADFEHIAWAGRTVFIVFDTNVLTNDSVRAARNELAREARRRGAIVRLVELPQIESINGVDDLLGLRGPDYVLALFETAKPHIEDKPSRKTQATVLMELAANVELFRMPEGDAYATIKVSEHQETWPLRSQGFRDWLMQRFYEEAGSAPSAQAVQDAIDVLRGRARYESKEWEVYTRAAEHEGSIYLDLCDEEWRVVRVSQDGWQTIDCPPVKFRRAKGMLPLPEPIRGGKIDKLRDFVNVAANDWPLIVCWLVATYRPGKPFPVLALHGEQGSAKSTTARVLRALIDPNKADLRSEPRDERDLMIAAKNGWLIALDNLSRIQTWLSDALCRLATGGGFATRTLYENDEETLFMAMRPIILNGIEELTTRSDLLDRSVIIHLPTIPPEKRKPEAEVCKEFECIRPFILGSLLDSVSHALRNIDYVQLEQKPRMADFALWAMAAEDSLELKRGTFISAFMGNRENTNELALEASPIASILIEFVQEQGSWKGKSSELLEEMNQRASEESKKQQGWPKRANTLSGALKRIAPNLRAIGVECNIGRTKAGSFITLEYKRKTSSTLSSSSSSTESAFTIESTCEAASDDTDDDLRVIITTNKPVNVL